MDCCGMPMAAWAGGGLVCRRCQATVGVSWRRSRNPLARCVEEAVEEDMAPVGAPDSFHVEVEEPAAVEAPAVRSVLGRGRSRR